MTGAPERGEAGSAGSCGWIPWVLVAGMGMTLAANAILVVVAIRSWPGLAAEAPFERGLAYNRVLAGVERQEALGWRVEIAFRPDAPGLRRGEVVVEMRDRDDRPLADLDLRAELTRPVDRGPGVVIAPRYDGDGRYRAAAELPRAGQWDVRVTAIQADFAYQASRRLFLP